MRHENLITIVAYPRKRMSIHGKNEERLQGRLLRNSSRWRSHVDRFQVPDFIRVFLDGAARRELTHVGDVKDRFLCPFGRTAISLVDSLLAVDIRAIVGEQEVVVPAAAQERLKNALKQSAIFGTEEPVVDLVDRL